MFYQAVVAAVLLYGSESWVLPPSALKVPEGFHVEGTQHMIGMQPQRRKVGPWIYLKSADVLTVARLRPVVTYIHRRRHNTAKTIEGWTQLQECRGAERRNDSSSRLMWWQQEMDLEEGDDGGAGGGGGKVLPRLFYDGREDPARPPHTLHRPPRCRATRQLQRGRRPGQLGTACAIGGPTIKIRHGRW